MTPDARVQGLGPAQSAPVPGPALQLDPGSASSSPELSVLAAMLNERENVLPFYDRLTRALEGVSWEAIVIDDASDDGTLERVEALMRRDPRVRLLRRPDRGGTASAQYDGWRLSRGRIMVVMDADLQHRPEDVPAVVGPVLFGVADLSIGSRYLPGGGFEKRPPLRGLISRSGELLARLILPETRGRSDPMSGFFAFRREVLDGPPILPQGMKFLFYLLVRVPASRIREVPILFHRREQGESKLVASQSRLIQALLSSALHARRGRPREASGPTTR